MSEPDEPVHAVLAELSQVPADGTLVDLGCGTGPTLAATSRRHPRARLVGLDRSAAALSTTRTHLTGHCGGLQLIQADLRQPLPLTDACADAVVSYNVLECLTDPAALVREAVRLLKPEGTLVLAHVDFDSIMVAGPPADLDRRVCHAFTDDRQPWMDHANGRIGRALPGLVAAAGLTLHRTETLTATSTVLTGHAERRLADMRRALLSSAARGTTTVTAAEVTDWHAAVQAAARDRRFFFSESVVVTVGRRT
ncbi:methyltransferase domain-containing protein [Kitasatospora sp. NPDC001309]|uniref:methyltransferase domain-containing protein n=1 Tax=Kitasatospora sp. NPDC001309 TaxID=3364013 RepID=UPI0036C98742